MIAPSWLVTSVHGERVACLAHGEEVDLDASPVAPLHSKDSTDFDAHIRIGSKLSDLGRIVRTFIDRKENK